MYDFKLANGDLAVRGDGKVALVSGPQRIAQDLSCWLLEPLGTDVVYSKFGSRLDSMVGDPATPAEEDDIRLECSRVVDDYVAYNDDRRTDDDDMALSDYAKKWTGGDIVGSVDGISVSTSGTTANVNVTFSVESGATQSVEETI